MSVKDNLCMRPLKYLSASVQERVLTPKFREITSDSSFFSNGDQLNSLPSSRLAGTKVEAKPALERISSGWLKWFLIGLGPAETVLTETVGWTRVTPPYSGFDSVACERIALAPRDWVWTCCRSTEEWL